MKHEICHLTKATGNIQKHKLKPVVTPKTTVELNFKETLKLTFCGKNYHRNLPDIFPMTVSQCVTVKALTKLNRLRKVNLLYCTWASHGEQPLYIDHSLRLWLCYGKTPLGA